MKNVTRRLKHRYRLLWKYRNVRRYGRLLTEVVQRRPRTIVEVGVFTGARSVEMIEAAALEGTTAGLEYFGFDLFDLFTDDVLESELSKKPLGMEEVRRRVSNTGASVALHRGLSQDTLPGFVESRAGVPVDFIFIDGGHAVETIRSDWNNLSGVTGPDTTVIFDDYYVDCPHLVDAFGCNRVLEALDPDEYGFEVITEPDCFEKPDGVLKVALARLWRK